MRIKTQTALMTLLAVAALSAAAAAPKPATLTGRVGDAMCGLTHMVKGDDAACTRACVKGGAEYALLVKSKVYTLKAKDAVKADLDKYADQRVTVTGELNGNTLEVASVRAAK